MVFSLRKIIPISAAFLLIITGFSLVEMKTEGSEFDLYTRDGSSEGSASLSGTFDIDEVSSTRIMGKYFGGPPTKLGEYVWTGDINDDGIEDLAISCPHAPGALEVSNGGILYIWYGGADFPLGSFDLQVTDPDVIIRGGHADSKLLSSMDVGDLDGDGNIDMILGIESQPECGRVYVLWGSGTDWPTRIELADIGVYEPNGNPFGVLNAGTYSIIGGYLRPVPLPFSDYKIGRSLAVHDLDNDGYDELVFSSPGWNNVTIVWGSGIRSDFGDNFTNIYDEDSGGSNGYGEVVKVGDLDNNGVGDLIVGSGKMNNPEFSDTKAGSVMVYYNVKSINGSDVVDAREGARPIIWGDDPYDEFGRYIEIEDINNDGFDDILVGVPGDDGPSDIAVDIGSIMVFHGGAENKFPKEFIGQDREDITIYGENEKVGSEPGDNLGSMFSIGNFDGDNFKDLLVAIPDRDIDNGLNAGIVSGYSGSAVFSKSSSPIDLGKTSSRFTFNGLEPEYGLGFRTDSADLNNDGLDDIICSSPSFDGVDLERSGAGEAHVIMGSPVYIGQMTLNGPGFNGEYLFTGGHTVKFNIPVYHSSDSGVLQDFNLVIDPTGENISLLINDDSITKNNDDNTLVYFHENDSGIERNGKKASISLNLSLNWYFPSSDTLDIVFFASGSDGSVVRRDFSGIVKLFRDISLKGGVNLKRNGLSVMSNSDWFAVDDEISFSGPEVLYNTVNTKVVYPDLCDIILLLDDVEVDRTHFSGLDWSLTHTIPDDDSSDYEILLERFSPPPEPEWDEKFLPDVGEPMEITVNIDRERPSAPKNLTFFPDYGITSDYDDDLNWRAEWESTEYHKLDGNSTGILGYEVTVNEDDSYYAMESGGLMGTYFFENDFTDPKITKLDTQVDENWGKWGPGGELPVYDFSIRWHGWFRASREASYRFSISGVGNGKLLLDDNDVFDWVNLETNPITPEYDLQAGEIVQIIIFYEQEGDSSSVTLRMEDDKGIFVPIPSTYLYYPSNRTDFKVRDSGPFNVSVRGIDWVGIVSDPVGRTGFVDTTAPIADLTGISNWYDTITPSIRFQCRDPNLDGYHGSGIDTNGVEFRLKKDGTTEYSTWYVDGVSVVKSTSGMSQPDIYNIMIEPTLSSNWTGTIQMKIKDAVGNEYITTQVKIGIDVSPPEFDIVYPDIRTVLNSNDITFTVKIDDIGGSGVDSSTAKGRFRFPGGVWSDWMAVADTGISEEIFLDFPMVLPYGDSEIQFSASDLVGNEGISMNYSIGITEPVVNLPPIPRIRSPSNNSRTPEGFPIQFDATGTTDDGLSPLGYLEYHWYSDLEGYIGAGKNISERLSIGFHNITLYVTDGGQGNNVSTKIRIEVFEIVQDDPNSTDPDDSSPDGSMTLIILIFLVIVLIIGTIAVFVFINHRRNTGEESMIGYRSMSEDDYIYDKQIDEEESKLGIKVDSNEKSGEEMDREKEDLYGDID